MSSFHFKGIIKYEINNRVSPSTGITIQMGIPLKLVHRGFTTRTDIDMDILAMVLDHRHDVSEGFDSTEFVL